MISCKELLELPSLKSLKIKGGQEGLNRYVRWVHFIDLPDILPWVQGGELLFITGIGLNDSESYLLKLVQEIAEKNLAGLVVNVGPYIPAIPPSVIKLADKLNFPVFELPWEVKLVQVTHDVSKYIIMKQMEEKSVNDLLESILFNPGHDIPTIIRCANYYGYDLSKPHQVGIARACNLEVFEQIVSEILHKYYTKILATSRLDSIIFLIPELAYKDSTTRSGIDIMQEIIDSFKLKLPGFTLNIGLGNFFTDLKYAKISFDQAQLSLKFADYLQEQNKVYQYNDLGVYKLISELENETLKIYHQETLGGLIDYDKKHSTELISTLSVYLQENSNSIQAAKKLFIHKNTLSYRIKKIEAITRKNLDNMHDRLTLQIALIIDKQITL